MELGSRKHHRTLMRTMPAVPAWRKIRRSRAPVRRAALGSEPATLTSRIAWNSPPPPSGVVFPGAQSNTPGEQVLGINPRRALPYAVSSAMPRRIKGPLTFSNCTARPPLPGVISPVAGTTHPQASGVSQIAEPDAPTAAPSPRGVLQPQHMPIVGCLSASVVALEHRQLGRSPLPGVAFTVAMKASSREKNWE